MSAVGLLLVVFGALFLLLGLITAVLVVFGVDRTQMTAQAVPVDPGAWAKFVKALTDLIKVAPLWLLLSGAGLGLILIGNGIT
jgi:hypothetical protein